ncbi:hypothetical protein P1J78_17375 [Psychromarinibacter sp. C21-152]|uniref:Uncharacterized protein n=1 Tax=Psychromarinibacter sediminicola TaxID=3033385 RepID=A0AAE3T9R2_9RHOB|nr:hypothetical protein [Psychromarinibacter sediminicola]MDF0602512.1 hypothetical protein [Psychromarinibacter sediminicola]
MYENVPKPHRPAYGLHDPDDRFRPEGGGTGWIWMAGIAVAVLLGLVIFGASGTTSVEHPGGASGIEQTAPAAAEPVPAPGAE